MPNKNIELCLNKKKSQYNIHIMKKKVLILVYLSLYIHVKYVFLLCSKEYCMFTFGTSVSARNARCTWYNIVVNSTFKISLQVLYIVIKCVYQKLSSFQWFFNGKCSCQKFQVWIFHSREIIRIIWPRCINMFYNKSTRCCFCTLKTMEEIIC